MKIPILFILNFKINLRLKSALLRKRKKLKDLHDDGVLSQDKFAAKEERDNGGCRSC